MVKLNRRAAVALVALLMAAPVLTIGVVGQAQEGERVTGIAAPTMPLPNEAVSKDVTKFSFIAYGDTRGRRDGVAIQYEHSLIVDSMLAEIKSLRNTDYAVRFILQSGDAVAHGQNPKEWNTSFVPLINRLCGWFFPDMNICLNTGLSTTPMPAAYIGWTSSCPAVAGLRFTRTPANLTSKAI